MDTMTLETLRTAFLQLFPEAEELFDTLVTSGVPTPEARKVRAIRKRIIELRRDGLVRLFAASQVAAEFGCTHDFAVSCMKNHNAAGEYIGFQPQVTW